MRKTLLIALISLSTLTFAQKLSVTPNGLRDSADIEKSFVVIPAEGKTAKQLYDDAVKYINKTYKSADDVIKGKTDGEYLKFVTYAPSMLMLKNGFTKVPFNAKYIIELNFKDGKVKYEIIELEIYNDAKYNLSFTGSGLSFFIYNKKGELKRETEKASIEQYFNGSLLSLTNFLQGKTTEDKW
jgi:hypothetical protein